jgi:hypothetical protein
VSETLKLKPKIKIQHQPKASQQREKKKKSLVDKTGARPMLYTKGSTCAVSDEPTPPAIKEKEKATGKGTGNFRRGGKSGLNYIHFKSC